MREMLHRAGAMGRRGVLAPVLVATLGGCDHSLDTVGGYDLGVPEAVVFGHNPQSRLMVVMSDLPGLCGDLQQSEPPETSDFWVVSAWTGSAAEAEGSYGASAFASVTRGGQVEEFSTTRADLEVDHIDEDDIAVEVDIVFDSTGDRLRASLEGEHCDARYFQGMEER